MREQEAMLEDGLYNVLCDWARKRESRVRYGVYSVRCFAQQPEVRLNSGRREWSELRLLEHAPHPISFIPLPSDPVATHLDRPFRPPPLGNLLSSPVRCQSTCTDNEPDTHEGYGAIMTGDLA